MIHARVISGTQKDELGLAFARMALPTAAREYLLAKIPFHHLLLTGMTKEEARFCKRRAEGQDAPGHETHPAFAPGDQRHRPGTALLSGRTDQLERLIAEAKEEEGMDGLVQALVGALQSLEYPEGITVGGRALAFGGRPLLMGIVNVTPDSFSDGGRFFDAEAAVSQGLALAEAGAGILDVGGESTRPGSAPVPVEEELRRTVPVIRALRERLPSAIVSIDTRKSPVARAAVEAGASMINDVSGLRFDPELAQVAAQAGAALCVMHIQGTPESMQANPRYEDSVVEILEFLEGAVALAVEAGVARERVMVDPGIGFGKTFEHNHFLLRRLRDFRALGLPVVVGHSRKAFLGALTGAKPAAERVLASAACAAVIAATGGADVLRVHDVAEAKEAVAVAEAVRSARDGGQLFLRG